MVITAETQVEIWKELGATPKTAHVMNSVMLNHVTKAPQEAATLKRQKVDSKVKSRSSGFQGTDQSYLF